MNQEISRIYYPREERICVMGGDASFITAAEQISRLVNVALKESGIETKVDIHWCNIADQELNPDRMLGSFRVHLNTTTIAPAENGALG